MPQSVKRSPCTRPICPADLPGKPIARYLLKVTEQQPYQVLQSHPQFEVRSYPAHLVAEVDVQAPFEEAGNAAFSTLLGYITGRNQARQSIAMTAPVLQGPGQKIAMTAPVVQAEQPTGMQTVAFVLPADLTPESAPVPTDPRVRIRVVPAGRAAAVRYSGRWSQASYERHCTELLSALVAHGYQPIGQPRFARFDPPFKPWFLRRNEVVIDLA